MTRIFDPEFVSGLGERIDQKVVPVLQSTNEDLPALSELDRSLYTTVTLPMAAAYSLATSTVTESMAGAAECFRQMRDALESCAKDMTDTDDACAQAFGGN
ncbi:hypothetical protein GCM10009830_02430 [Glycomyces endophyticus]|uniref:ESX-1 secretion-associated protein n=1 Tax=Glycomyces endophyticus TaxID=480996 RepID=A0ABP4RS64_9ACTN